MTDRPRKPEYSAARVIKASRVLSWGEKAVWLEDYGLDGTLDGSYLPGAELGTRLAMTGSTVDRYRSTLKQVGLYETRSRQGKYRRSWYCTFLAGLPPRSQRMTPEELELCRAAFDATIAEPLSRQHLLSEPGKRSEISERIFEKSRTNVPVRGREAAREGGQGGEAPTSSVRSTSLHPEEEAGGGASAPEAKDGDGHWEPIDRPNDRRPAGEVSEEAFENIAERKRQWRQAAGQ